MALDVRDNQMIDTLKDVGGGVESSEINGRPATQADNPTFGDCTLAMQLDDRSRIDVGVTGPNDTNTTCQVAQDVAYIIEPRLPELES